MQISIAALSHEHTPSVREFNITRLAAHGVLYRSPVSPVPNWLPQRDPLPWAPPCPAGTQNPYQRPPGAGFSGSI
jgi:hypothetical protein